MRIKTAFRKMLAAAIVAGTFAVMPLASAEVKEYEGFGEYVMSDFETPDVAKQRAKARAEQNAMEQAGMYVESYTKVINHQVTHDEIATMTNGILKVKDVQYKMTPTDDGKAFLIHATIKADIDTDDISKWLGQSKQRLDMLVEQNKALQKAKEEQEQQIEKLKRQVVNEKSKQDKESVQAQFYVADQEFLSNQKTEEGLRAFVAEDNIGATVLLSQAVELNPKNAKAYAFLGGAYYYASKDTQKALENCNIAVALEPQYAMAYFIRGTIFVKANNYMKAIVDYTKAIELDSQFALAYGNRGHVYNCLGDYLKALADFTKTVELIPTDAQAYNNRGSAYKNLGDYAKAIIDFTKAIELNPKIAIAYSNRGSVFNKLKDYTKAIADFTKAIEIEPKYVSAYINRSVAYIMLGNSQKAIADCTRAIDLDSKEAIAYYNRGVAYKKLGNIVQANADFAMAKSLGYTP